MLFAELFKSLRKNLTNSSFDFFLPAVCKDVNSQ